MISACKGNMKTVRNVMRHVKLYYLLQLREKINAFGDATYGFCVYLCLDFYRILMTSQNQAIDYILPSEELQRQMLSEERSFLDGMKPGLQHTQMLAVRAAIQGDNTALNRIRMSRNQPPTLPEGVATFFPTPDICLFLPVAPANHKRPLLLYLHGGGWCFGSINSCSRFCASLALQHDCGVAALNYRLSPEHPFPTPLNDCQKAFAYLTEHAEEWGGDPLRISVGGDSAGGNLSLATAMTTPGVHSVVAIYPVTKLFTACTASWRQYAEGYGDDAELLEAFNEAYANHEERNPLVSVGLASDDALHSLPPVLILSARHDILFDQTLEFAQRLKALRHQLEYHVFPTAAHLFITVPGQPTAFREAAKKVGSFLNKA